MTTDPTKIIIEKALADYLKEPCRLGIAFAITVANVAVETILFILIVDFIAEHGLYST